MTVLVTGIAGFLGSQLCDQLMVMGHTVKGIDDFSQGSWDNLEKWLDKKTKTTHPKLEVIRGDIRNKDDVRKAVHGVDWIFHCAAKSRIFPSVSNPTETYDVNVNGTLNILEAAREFGVKRVVYSASSSAYGLKNSIPNREDMSCDCLNSYSLSKYHGEMLMELYHKLYGISTVSLRYFNLYGIRPIEEGLYATVIAIFRRQKRLGKKLTVVGDGSKRRDFTFSGDAVHANIKAAMAYHVNGTINIGSGKNYSILEVAKLIAEGDESMIEFVEDRPAEARETLADISKAKKVLGWTPKLSLEQGLKVIDAYELKYKPKSSNLIIMP